MKKYFSACFLALLVGLLAVQSLQSIEQTTGTWTKKTDFGGIVIRGAAAFSIGTKGYLGTGIAGSRSREFWEYDPTNDTWTQKAVFGGTARF